VKLFEADSYLAFRQHVRRALRHQRNQHNAIIKTLPNVYSVPDTKTINRKAEKEIRDLKDLLFPPGYEASSNSVKRKAAAPKTTAKKSKDAVRNFMSRQVHSCSMFSVRQSTGLIFAKPQPIHCKSL